MKVAIVNALYATPQHPRIIGGAEVFARQFAEALVEGGDEVMVICNSLVGRRETEVVNGVRIEFIPVRNLFPPFQDSKNVVMRTAWHAIDDWQWAHPDIDALLSGFAPHIVHSNTLNGLTADIWRLARERGAAVVHTLHDYYLVCPRCSRFKGETSCGHTCRACALLSVGRRRQSRLVNAVVSVSQRTLDIHKKSLLFSGASHHVVRNVPNQGIAFMARPRPETPLRIGYLGRFSPEKGVGLLVQAVGRQPPSAVKLLLAGNVPAGEKSRLQALASGADVEFVGFVSPAAFYAAVDVIAMPSLWEEPGALALVDALAAGRPVIATALGGIPEVVENGKTGWIVDESVQAFAELIGRLVADPTQVFDAHTRLRDRPTRTFVDLLDEYRHIYRSVNSRG
jgi:glycosyltransferase involved in cell wall biosynthesis